MKSLLSISDAVRIYYTHMELETEQINAIFGKLSTATLAKYRKAAREQMAIDGVPLLNNRAVDTVSAYKAWHLDIDAMERRLKKLKQMEAYL